MPTHYKTKPTPKEVKKRKDKPQVLTQRQKDTLKRHEKHHTKKHIKEMTKLMKQGKTFSESHKIAMKKVGK
jgi:hypothetical protein